MVAIYSSCVKICLVKNPATMLSEPDLTRSIKWVVMPNFLELSPKYGLYLEVLLKLHYHFLAVQD